MRKTIILSFVGLMMLIGCASYSSYNKYSTNDVPIQNRRLPSGYPTLLISSQGPQLNPQYYEIMGRVTSVVDSVTVFENHCRGAMEMLRYEARNIGSDAVINLDCGSGTFGAKASGMAIYFKNREEVLKALEEIKPVFR